MYKVDDLCRNKHRLEPTLKVSLGEKSFDILKDFLPNGTLRVGSGQCLFLYKSSTLYNAVSTLYSCPLTNLGFNFRLQLSLKKGLIRYFLGSNIHTPPTPSLQKLPNWNFGPKRCAMFRNVYKTIFQFFWILRLTKF